MTLDGRRVLLAFVRGESTWRELLEFGMEIQFGGRTVIKVPADFPVVRPTLNDVAAGLIAHPDATSRQQWAAVFLGIDNIDLVGVEQERSWPRLLEAIWDAFGGQISEPSLAFARSLLARSVRRH